MPPFGTTFPEGPTLVFDDRRRRALEKNEVGAVLGGCGTYGSVCSFVRAPPCGLAAGAGEGCLVFWGEVPFASGLLTFCCCCGDCDENLELMLDIHEPLRFELFLFPASGEP
jgi:hypothetical protein